MKKIYQVRAAILAACMMMSSVAFADVTLKMGDPAPKLSVSKFVKGEPVKGFEKGKIYVVEFWATWCGPCRVSIPHLTEMQKANPDVIFIGSDVGEDEAKVTPFVNEMADKMDYRVAIDDMTKEGGANNSAFMEAAGQNGIPTAFLIDKDSNVAWIGHPMELEPVLKEVVAGTYDMKKASAAAAAKAKVMGFLQTNDLDGAMKASDEIIASDPTQANTLGTLQFQILLMGKKDPVAAAKKADELSSKIDQPEALNMMAWTLATSKSPADQTIDTAKKLSELSLEKKADNAEYLDTLARIYAVKKDFTKATELETKAVEKCSDEKLKAGLTEALSSYKSNTIPADK